MLYVNKPNWCTNKLSQEKHKGLFDQHDTAFTKFQSFHVLGDAKRYTHMHMCMCAQLPKSSR